MPTPAETLADPEFQQLPVESRRRVLSKIDPEFAKLPPESQGRILEKSASKPSVGSRIAGRALSTLGGALNPLPALSAGFQSLAASGRNKSLLPDPKPLYEQFVAPQVEQFKKAGQQLGRVAHGDLSGIPGAVMYTAGGLLPGYGPAITGAVEEATPVERGGQGKVPEAVGTLIGAGAAGPAIELGLRGVGRVAKAAARPMERSTLSFKEDASLPARRAATEKGLEIGTPTTEKGMGEVSDYVTQKSAEVDKVVAEMKAKKQYVDTYRILDEVDKEAQSYADSLFPTNPSEAARAMRRDLYLRLGGQEIDVAGPNGTVQKALVRGARYMDPEEVQVAKRATSRMLRKAYGEEKSPGIETMKAGERGAKEAMEEGAAAAGKDIKGPNWQEHVALTLKDAIERTLKRQPAFLDRYGMFILGGGAVAALEETARGNFENIAGIAAGTGASLLIEKALRNPAVMSRLAIALDRAGTVLPRTAKLAGRVQPALTLGSLNSPPIPPSRLENPDTN